MCNKAVKCVRNTAFQKQKIDVLILFRHPLIVTCNLKLQQVNNIQNKRYCGHLCPVNKITIVSSVSYLCNLVKIQMTDNKILLNNCSFINYCCISVNFGWKFPSATAQKKLQMCYVWLANHKEFWHLACKTQHVISDHKPL